MHFSSHLLNQAAMAACWTLVHSLWQGLVLVILTGLVMVSTRKSRPVVRYRLLSVLMVFFVAAAAMTFALEWSAQVGRHGVAQWPWLPSEQAQVHEPGQTRTARAVADVVSVTGGEIGVVPVTGSGVAMWERVSGFLSEHAMLIVAVWLIILGVRLARMCSAMAYTRHIRRHLSQASPEEWNGRLNAMCERMGFRRPVLLLESAVMKIPAVFGHLKPVIFVPLGFFSQVSPGQAEAILLHELAHIKRNDYLMNLLQNMAVHLFFFNPAVLWLSALLREEREHCCDEMAIAGTGDKKQLIRALVGFRELSLGSGPIYGMGFAGSRNVFVNRIARIVQNKNKGLTSGEGVFFGCCVLLVGFLAMAFTQGGHGKTGDGPRIAVVSGLAGRQEQVVTGAAPTQPYPPMSLKKDTLPVKDGDESQRDRLVSLDVDLAHGKQVVVAWYKGRLYHITQVNGVVTQLSIGDISVSPDKLDAYRNTVQHLFERLDRVRVDSDDQQLLNDSLGIAQGDRMGELLRAGENQEFAKDELAKRLAEMQVSQEATNRELAKRLAEMSVSQAAASRELAKRLAEMQAAQLDTNWQNGNREAVEKAIKEQERALDLQRGDLLREQENLERQLMDKERAEAGYREKLLDAKARVRAILDEIVVKGIVSDITRIHSYLLTKDGFFVNGKQQSASVYEQFVKEFVPDSDRNKQFRFEFSNK
jgi:bla regulator protein BlaR1